MQSQIDATDAEIDRLVYDLYGMTAEEIALVEGQEQEDTSQVTEVRIYGFRLPLWPIIGIRNNEVPKMLRDYIQTAMRQAEYEILPDDRSFYGEIPGFDGVYANADKLEKCREELEEVLEEWILMRVSRNLPLPVVEGIELVIKETA